jgi:hypothetical protein
LLATVGVSDLVVVATPDAVLVADKAKAQEVKALVDELKRSSRAETEFRHIVHRPWGSYEGVAHGPRYPGQTHPGQARGQPESAEAPPSRRTLDRRQGGRQ